MHFRELSTDLVPWVTSLCTNTLVPVEEAKSLLLAFTDQSHHEDGKQREAFGRDAKVELAQKNLAIGGDSESCRIIEILWFIFVTSFLLELDTIWTVLSGEIFVFVCLLDFEIG